ncbi:MAG: DUF1561 family protein [Malacoplasma sp.]|nr:DUF1561 family protein [Malacoplasma sp.]MDE7100098.1 DUF1561 family protein [Malacoplasma sp.]
MKFQKIEERGIISGSDSPDSSLRFFGGMLNEPEDPLEYYLYEIRADENVYSAERTASFYHQRISTGQIEFEEGDLQTAIDAVDAIFREFAYQREWFNVGPIPRERVRAAWRIDSVSILPTHIRHPGRTVYYTPRINEPEMLNSHYVEADTYANDLPYTEGATLVTPSTVSVPSQLVESDASGGVSSSLGFACSLNPESPHRSKRSSKSSDKLKCYYDTKKVVENLDSTQPYEPVDFSKAYPVKIYLRGSSSKRDFILSTSDETKNCFPILVYLRELQTNSQLIPNFIYDSFQCISWTNDNFEFSWALTPKIIGKIQTYYALNYTVASTNNPFQKWKLEPVKIDNEECLFLIRNIELSDFCLKRDVESNQIWLRPIKEKDDTFEDLYLVVAQNKTESCILLPQDSKTKLVDLGLSWFYQNINYVPIPETNRSKQSKQLYNLFFYDLKTCKIVYIDMKDKTKRNIYALFNKRGLYDWNWIAWRKSDLKPTDDARFRWYFQNEKWKEAYDDLSLRNIRSYFYNDYLRVVLYGTNWGCFYTTKYSADKNSIALFRISKYTDI